MISQIKSYLEDVYPDILKTLEDITAIDRESKNVIGLTEMANYLEKRLYKLGCSVERFEDDCYGPTLIGRKKGSGKHTIMLYAHMDTVWPAGTYLKRPFRIENNRAYGPGVSDCSHGILGTLYSIEALEVLGINNYKEIIILFNSDEELYSPGSEKYITEYAKYADVAFCMESSDVIDEYISHRGGVMFFDIEVKGIKSHAGGMPEKGRNAIEELAHKISMIHQIKVPNAYLHTTLIKGGINEGVVPDYAWAHVDVRVDTMEAFEEVEREMQRIEADTLIEGTTTTCRQRSGGCLPMIRVPEQDKFCKLIDEVSTEEGHPLHEAFCGGGANAVLSALAGTPTLDGVTPISGCWHTDQEYLELSTVVPRITVLAEVIRRICGDDMYLKSAKL